MISDFIASLWEIVMSLGCFGIFLGLMVEVIPSEIVLAYGGFMVSIGKVTFTGAVVAGVIGGVLAQLMLYWLGFYGGRYFIERFGKYVFLSVRHLQIAERWFAQYGTGVVFMARFVPIVRHMISIPAGMVRMNVWRFLGLTTAAIIPWSILFTYLGYTFGSNWASIKQLAAPYMLPIAFLAIVLGALYIWLHKK